jgi:integrase
MPITRHHSGRWLYQFDRVLPHAGRTRANKLLPQGWTKHQAQEYDRVESARLYALASGVTPAAEPLIDDAVLLYLTEHAPSLKNHTDIEGALAILHPHYTGRPLSMLPAIALGYATEQAGILAPATVRNRLAYLRAACRWAWKRHSLGQHDPAERMQLPKVSNTRQFYFDHAAMLQLARTIKANPGHSKKNADRTWQAHRASRSVLRVAFYTGLRVAEVLRAQPVQAMGQPALLLADTKNGAPHIVPVHPRIAHLVRAKTWPPKVTKWVVSKHFKAAARALGLEHLRFHDSRHSAASEMINNGVDLNTVGDVLNHKSHASTKRYAHLATTRLQTAIGQIGKRTSVNNPQPAPSQKAA